MADQQQAKGGNLSNSADPGSKALARGGNLTNSADPGSKELARGGNLTNSADPGSKELARGGTIVNLIPYQDSIQEAYGIPNTFMKEVDASYAAGGPPGVFAEEVSASYNEAYGVPIALDSTDTASPRITNWVQRTYLNKGDLSGILYNTTGNPISLVAAYYSKDSISGPWILATIIGADPLYDWPSGSAAGDAFNIPLSISDNFSGNIWFKIETLITYGGGPATVIDINGPYDWEYVPAPVILAVVPNSGLLTGNTAVTINGTGFQPMATVTFGGVLATSVAIVGTTSITCKTPAHELGAVDVVVQNLEQSVTLFGGFTYIPLPKNIIEEIRNIRSMGQPLSKSINSIMPPAMAERLLGISPINVLSSEPDPSTFKNKHYYNSKTNRLYVKIETSPIPVWRPIGG